MEQNFLSDWTLDAFQRREQERRRNERDEAVRLRLDLEKPRSSEILRSDWTVAALQKRFVAVEQRLAALEQREEERRQKELLEPPQAPPKEERRGREAFLGDPIEPGEARTNSQLEAVRLNESALKPEVAAPIALDAAERSQKNRGKIRPVKEEEAAPVGVAHGMLRGLFSVAFTACIAGALGFGIGVSAVPIDRAAHFRSLIGRGLDSLHGTGVAFEERLHEISK